MSATPRRKTQPKTTSSTRKKKENEITTKTNEIEEYMRKNFLIVSDNEDDSEGISDEEVVEFWHDKENTGEQKGSVQRDTDYFSLKSHKSKTSDNTLTELPLLDRRKIQQILERMTISNEDAKKNLTNTYR